MTPCTGIPKGEAFDSLPNRRAQAKLQTRQKVLVAARQMFAQQGYEGATIRDIATAAGMSTGAVFANFTDKSDLFCDIMADRAVLALLDQLDRGGDLSFADPEFLCDDAGNSGDDKRIFAGHGCTSSRSFSGQSGATSAPTPRVSRVARQWLASG